jgi:type IX secretion system PorP/SprF family membrane protein
MKAPEKYFRRKAGPKKPRFKALLIFAVILLFIIPEAKTQDVQFSQFTMLPLYYNPAYTGLEQGMRAKFAYRRQWVKMPEEFKAMNFNMDIAARGIPGSGGLGLMFDSSNEGTGLIKRNSFGLNLAVRIPIMEDMVSQFGISASFVQKHIDWSRLVFSDQLDPNYGNIYTSDFAPPSSNKVIYPDFGIGGIFRFAKNAGKDSDVIGTFGFAVQHVFEPNESFINLESKLPVKVVATLDFQVQQSKNSRGYNDRGFKFNPAIIYMNQAGMDSWSVGINIYKQPIYVGVWYRNSEFQFLDNSALIIVLGLNVNFGDDARMKFLYSYDAMLTDITKATGGSHELTLIFELDDMRLFGANRGGGFDAGNKAGYKDLECSPF